MLQGIDEFQQIKKSFSSLEEFQTALKADPDKYGAALPQVSGYTYTESDREEYIQAYSLSSNDTIRNEVNGMDQSLLSIKDKKFPSVLPVLTMISSENVQNVPAWETAHRNQLDLESGNHQLYIVKGGHYIWYTNLTQPGYVPGNVGSFLLLDVPLINHTGLLKHLFLRYSPMSFGSDDARSVREYLYFVQKTHLLGGC